MEEVKQFLEKDNSAKISRITTNVLPIGVCELQVGYRRLHIPRTQLTNSKQIVDFVIEHCYQPSSIEYRESCFALFLDRSNKVFSWKMLSQGGINGTIVDPRLLFQAALLVHANYIILVHNHPSGNTQPSKADIELTHQIKESGNLLMIPLLDHVIVTKNNDYYSFADNGTL